VVLGGAELCNVPFGGGRGRPDRLSDHVESPWLRFRLCLAGLIFTSGAE